EIIDDPECWERAAPSAALLYAVLRAPRRTDPDVLAAMRRLTARVAAELSARIEREVRAAFAGPRDRRSGPRRGGRQELDVRRSVQHNLRSYDPTRRRITLERPLFFARARHHAPRWTFVVAVDQSASMGGSVISAAVTASCLAGVPQLDCRLFAFDTQVVELTAHLEDPTELLTRVQLGGGTDLARALDFADALIERPDRSVIVLISDLYEGESRARVIERARRVVERGVRLLVVGALDREATPTFDRELGEELARIGATVAAMTPGQLAEHVARECAS
ncbi:MAG: VWA domain-containing protein, partial [Sandaracinaceae bacterium]